MTVYYAFWLASQLESSFPRVYFYSCFGLNEVKVSYVSSWNTCSNGQQVFSNCDLLLYSLANVGWFTMSLVDFTSDFSKLSGLFEEHVRRRPMIDFCLKHSKGRMLVDSMEAPTSAMLVYRSAHVIAGNPNNHEFLQPVLASIPKKIWGLIIPHEKWIPVLNRYWQQGCETIKRIELDSDSLDLTQVTKFLTLPEGYTLQRLEKKHLFNMHMDLLYDAIIDFESFKNFEREGIAFCVVDESDDDKVISVASSVYPFTTELEIQVKTHPQYRRRGFGLSSSAALIEYCLQNDVKVYVDAAHDGSRDMALQLGFTNPEEWLVYKPA